MFKKLITITILNILLIFGTPLIQPQTFAQDQAQSALEKLRQGDLEKITESKILEDKNVQFVTDDLETKVFPRILRIVFSMSSLLIMIIFVYSGVRLVLSQGDEEELGKAKDMLIYSIIGAVIIMVSFGLVTGIVGFLTNLNN